MTIDRASVEHGARLAAEALPTARRRLRTNAVAWHTKFHERRIDFEECEVTSCINDQDALTLIDAALAHWNPEFAGEVARDWLRLKEELAEARLDVQTSEEDRESNLARAEQAEAELQRLWRVEEAAQGMDSALDRAQRLPRDSWFSRARSELRAALANPVAEAGDRFHAGHGANPHPNCPVCANPAAEEGE